MTSNVGLLTDAPGQVGEGIRQPVLPKYSARGEIVEVGGVDHRDVWDAARPPVEWVLGPSSPEGTAHLLRTIPRISRRSPRGASNAYLAWPESAGGPGGDGRPFGGSGPRNSYSFSMIAVSSGPLRKGAIQRKR